MKAQANAVPRFSIEPASPTGRCGASSGAHHWAAKYAANQPTIDSTSKTSPRIAPMTIDSTRIASIARSIAADRHVQPASQGQHDRAQAGGARLGQRAVGFLARRERADAHADAAARRGLRDLGVGLQAELLGALAHIARRTGIGKGADLDDEAPGFGRRMATAVEQRAGARRIDRSRRRGGGRGDLRWRLLRRFGGLLRRVAGSDRRGFFAASASAGFFDASATTAAFFDVSVTAVALPAGPAAPLLLSAFFSAAATSCPASAELSVMTASCAAPAGADAVPGAAPFAFGDAPGCVASAGRAGGITSGGAASLRGISIGMSSGIGRGWVSNTSGKPMMPTSSRTTAPISRRRACVRARCTASAGSSAGAWPAVLRLNLESKPMRSGVGGEAVERRCRGARTGDDSARQPRCLPLNRGKPFFNTPPTV